MLRQAAAANDPAYDSRVVLAAEFKVLEWELGKHATTWRRWTLLRGEGLEKLIAYRNAREATVDGQKLLE